MLALMDDEQTTQVLWECGGSACKDMEDCLAKLLNAPKGEEFIICSREGGFLQAMSNDDRSYHCEVSLPSESGDNDLFENPDAVSLEELASLFYRYSQGEDFSWARDKWNYLDFKKNTTEKFVPLIVIFVMAAVLIFVYFYSNR